MSRVIELLNCQDPRQVVSAAAAADRELATLAEALALRTVETPDGRATVAPTMAEVEGARVHVVSLPQERRADGTITPPAAVVIVDGPQSEEVASKLDRALLSGANVKAEYAELADGVRVVLAGPSLADTGSRERLAKAERLAALVAEPVKDAEKL